MYTCSRCEELKPPSEFYKSKNTRGLQYHCKACQRGASCDKHHSDPEHSYFQRIRHRYGLERDRYLQMLEEQDGCCAICDEKFTARPHVDHCHSTGSVRGLLCENCNRGLGMFKDNQDHLHAAIHYLEVHHGSS